MAETIDHLPPIRQTEQNTSAVTGRTNTIEVSGIRLHVLEMEDVLFHLESAMMMPVNPAGRSASQGTTPAPGSPQANNQAQQTTMSGIEALALAFKQLEFNPNLKTVIAAHADTSGDVQYNFSLSEDRGANVHALLTGNEDEWVKSVERRASSGTRPDRHKIEDYQQVLTWVAVEKSWPCDPQGINNTWGTNTENAVKAFLDKAIAANLLSGNADVILADIRNHPKKIWPEAPLRSIFKLFDEKLRTSLGETAAGMTARRTVLLSSFLHSEIHILPCGEAFPIDSSARNNYRSQKNRRVEVLFFDPEDLQGFDPASFEAQCPLATKSTVTQSRMTDYKTECPIWPFRRYFAPLYIDPEDLNSILYHLRFSYFNKVWQQVRNIPAVPNLVIRAFEQTGSGAAITITEIPTVTVFRNDNYLVKIRYPDPPSNHDRGALFFRFETTDSWIYTADATTAPAIRTVIPADFRALSSEEKYHHYDIPPLWESRNWECSKGTATDAFKTIVANATTDSEPIVFNLDTIVLIQSNGVLFTQDIKDADHQIPALPKPLDPNKSRIKILYIDTADSRLKLYRSGAAGTSSRVPFSRNRFTSPVNNTVGVHFNDSIYSIGRRRTAPEIDWVVKKMVVGARAALKNDADLHLVFDMYQGPAEFQSTGDFELHYFHHVYLKNRNPVSYLMSYISVAFMGDTRDNTQAPIPTDADVLNYVDTGIYNAMDHWNRKQYFYEETAPNTTSTIIYPFYFFDERETFIVVRPAAGFNIDFGLRPNHATFFSLPAIQTAQQAAFGGRPRFLALVCKDENGQWGPAYQWSIRGEGPQHYSLFKLNKSGGQNCNGMFPGVPVTEHGEAYGAHTFAHELGHATGQPDEYVHKEYQPDPAQVAFVYPNFDQFYVCYSMDYNSRSMMHSNAAPRLHHCWFPLHRINRGIATVPLSNMLAGKQFVARLQRDATWSFTFIRHLGAADAAHFQKPAVLTEPMQRAQQHQLSNPPLKRVHLSLFDTGRDESSCKTYHAGQNIEYQAVLVIRVLMAIDFIGGGWSGANQRAKIAEINDEWGLWNQHYRLINGSRDIQRIYVRLLPGFAAAGAANANYNVRLTRSNHSSGDRIPNTNGTITVHRNVSANELIRYMFNTALNHGDAGAIDFARTWINTLLGTAFTIQCF